MTRETWGAYMDAENLARELGLVIDYRADFERWFIRLLDTVTKELQAKKGASSQEVAGE
jgi:hypothetical protein